MSGDHPAAWIFWCVIERLADGLSIGEVAAILRVSPHTIRAWERRRDGPRPGRTSTNQRRYTVEHVRALARLRRDQPAERAAEIDQPVWRFIADQLDAPILILAEDGCTVDVNLAMARALGARRERLLRRPFGALVERRERAAAAAIAMGPRRQRRGWAVTLRATGSSAVRLTFDCWPALHSGARMLVLVGR